jgi:hypothetical protein
VDTEEVFYTSEVLIDAKRRHEQWMEKLVAAAMGEKESLRDAFEGSVLQRLRNGRDLINLLRDAAATSWGWPPLESPTQAEAAGTFADLVNDLSDTIRCVSFETEAKAEIILNSKINALEQLGLFLYGRQLKQLTDVPGGRDILLTSVFRLTKFDHHVFIDLGLVPQELLLA